MMRTTILVMTYVFAGAACMLDDEDELDDGENLEEIVPAGGTCGNGMLCMYQAAYPARGLYRASPVQPGKCYSFDGRSAPARFNDSISQVNNRSNYWVRLSNYAYCGQGRLTIGPNESRILNEFNDVTSSFMFIPVGQPH